MAARLPDQYARVDHQQTVAEIRAAIGDADGALAVIRDLLGRPSYLTVNDLRMNPVWDLIRGDPRFKALLQ